MKKVWITLLLCCFTLTTAFAEESLVTKLQKLEIPVEIHAQGMLLEDFLALLSQETGVRILAAPAAADIKIDLQVRNGQTIGQVEEMLQSNYGLVFRMNDSKNTVLVLASDMQEKTFVLTSGWGMMGYGNAPPSPSFNRGPAAPLAAPRPFGSFYNTEEYKHIYDNSYQDTLITALSTFSIDVDTASYSNMRRYINNGTLPPADSIRTEEMLNYFRYDDPQPVGEHPFSVTTEVNDCPWQPGHKLVLIGLQGKNIDPSAIPPCNLVFLIDVSGSMNAPNRLPLVKAALKLLVSQLRPEDKVSIVVYAGSAGLVLPPTSGDEKGKIIKTLDSLCAGGSTAGGEGLALAYKIAQENFISAGNNRVILATDGDFNVGVSSEGELTRLIEEKRANGVFLNVLGFGMGNIKDNKMEALADKGNGNYAYIDNMQEAKKVLVEQMTGTLYTIAKDVKLQVEFNPAKVKSYRLIGYEDRVLASADFNNDAKDAGDMGVGHSVTALYEVIPAGSGEVSGATENLIYQRPELVPSNDWLQVKVRYKKPGEETSTLVTERISNVDGATTSDNLRFAAAVAEFSMLLRNSEFKGQSNFQQVLELAQGARGNDEEGYRAEFIRMVKVAELLQ
ncbi:MAG: von Willebrand factor [Firmicutes bacterium]|nr:von Willebrand factor [Bacillota bacterium]